MSKSRVSGRENRNKIAVYLKNAQIPTPTFYIKEHGQKMVTTAPQKAGYGAKTGRAAGLSTPALPPCFASITQKST